MSAIFLTGGTGYLGSYLLDSFARQESPPELHVLTRAADRDEGLTKLWRAMQLHWDEDTFHAQVPRIHFHRGDLTAPGLGLSAASRAAIADRCETVLHCAASLNRKSEKACLNTNLRGTLAVIELARQFETLRRFSYVSTVAVAGKRAHEVVTEDDAIDWARSDYDPYARTKKFGEHMVRTLLADTETVVFRPSIVMGDSRFPRTSQFDMVRATILLADLPFIPFAPEWRVDIVNADWVGHAIATLHTAPQVAHDTYHLSAGTSARTIREIASGVLAGNKSRTPPFLPRLGRPTEWTFRALNRFPRKSMAAQVGALMKVFLPYVTFDTVFDSSRAQRELGVSPTPFPEYASGLYRWCKENNYRLPRTELTREVAA